MGDGFFCLNAAPARPVPSEVLGRADLIVANSLELDALGSTPGALFALTLGAEGALLLEDGEEVARAAPPDVDAVDGTAAGTPSPPASSSRCSRARRARRRSPRLRRRRDRRLPARARSPRCPPRRRLTRYCARVSDPTPILLDCDPGHDDAIALLLALASPELDLLGVTTVAGNQTLEKTTANALRVLELVGRGRRGRRRRRRPAARPRALHRRLRARGVRARRAGPPAPAARAGRAARGRLPRRADPRLARGRSRSSRSGR